MTDSVTSRSGTDHLARVFGIAGCGMAFYLLYEIGEFPGFLTLPVMAGLVAAMAYHLSKAASEINEEEQKNVA